MIDLTKFSFLSKKIEFFVGVNSSTSIVVATSRGIVCQGTMDYCMNEVREFAVRCQPDRVLRFNVGNNVSNNVTGMRAAADDVKANLKGYLTMMASSCRCKVEVYAGMNTTFA